MRSWNTVVEALSAVADTVVSPMDAMVDWMLGKVKQTFSVTFNPILDGTIHSNTKSKKLFISKKLCVYWCPNMEVAVTKMSSNGQIVISSDIRKALGLSPGDKFLVIGEKDGIVLRSLKKEDIKQEMERLLSDIGEEIEKSDISKEDVAEEIQMYRKGKGK